MKHIYLILSLSFTCFMAQVAFGQNGSVSTGGTASGPGGSVTYSVGQLLYHTNSSAEGTVSEGLQQAYEIYLVGTPTVNAPVISLTAYPNPTLDFLYLNTNGAEITNGQYEVYDFSGKLIATAPILGNETPIDMSTFATATYFIIIKNNQQLIQTFKIIKN